MFVSDPRGAVVAFYTDLAARGLTAPGLAVSGGGDSLALLDLAFEEGARRGIAPAVATVDHRLRPEAAREAEMVARFCAERGLAHTTLVWHGDALEAGNLQAEARSARYRLLADWAASQGLGAVALGHNLEDLAETFLMRLSRAAGLDGLAAMAPAFTRHNMLFLRPLLGVPRQALRDHLKGRGIDWAEDPSNENPDYERVRMRGLLTAMEAAGLTATAIASSALALSDSRAWAERSLQRDWQARVQVQGADLLIAGLPEDSEPARRVMQTALRLVGDQAWPLRRAKLLGLLDGLRDGVKRSLAGCVITQRQGVIRISRELQAVQHLRSAPGDLFDNRWHLSGPAREGSWLAPLGEGILLCPDWRKFSPLPRGSLMAAPALWGNEGLIAAPLARAEAEYSLRLRKGWENLPFVH